MYSEQSTLRNGHETWNPASYSGWRGARRINTLCAVSIGGSIAPGFQRDVTRACPSGFPSAEAWLIISSGVLRSDPWRHCRSAWPFHSELGSGGSFSWGFAFSLPHKQVNLWPTSPPIYSENETEFFFFFCTGWMCILKSGGSVCSPFPRQHHQCSSSSMYRDWERVALVALVSVLHDRKSLLYNLKYLLLLK